MKKKVPLPKALAIIVLSTLLISGSAFICLRNLQKHQIKRRRDPRYTLQYLQTKSVLPQTYIEELLGLSSENPISYYQFNENLAKEKLLNSPYITKAHVEKKFPQNLKITIKTRTPIAQLYDFENTLIDEEGRLMPAYPLYKDLSLPQIYLGLQDFDSTIYQGEEFWKEQFSGEDFALALRFLALLSRRNILIKRVDLSNRQNKSLGKRELVLILQNDDQTTHTLRLPAKNWEQQLANYFSMRAECDFFGKDRIIDLRLASLAYISD